MPREMGLPVYYKYDDLEPQTQLVVKGEYIGTTQGKFGDQFNFLEVETHRHVVLSGRSLAWRVEQGHMNEGEVFDIYFEGKVKLTKGQMAGKDVVNFKLLKYSRDELPGFKATKAPADADAVARPAAKVSAKAPEALDDLE